MGKIEVPRTDEGEVNFNVDFGAGKIAVSIRPPLSITKQTASLAIVDFIEIASKILLESCKLQKAQAAHFAANVGKKEEHTA
jgi:phosphopantothenate synthetase